MMPADQENLKQFFVQQIARDGKNAIATTLFKS
jgi:hypothetical protein